MFLHTMKPNDYRQLLSSLLLFFLASGVSFAQGDALMASNSTSMSPNDRGSASSTSPKKAIEAEAGQLEHLASSHIDTQGKIYWQKRLPVYLFVSDNAGGTEAKKLESQATSDYANPFYLDTEGVNYVRTRWAVDEEGNKVMPEREVMFEIYADGIAPSTSVNVAGESFRNSEGAIFYGKEAQVSALALDQMSGVKETYVSINGKSYQPYHAPITLSEETDYNIRIYSVDNVGNTEEERTRSFTIDATAPVTIHSILGDFTENVLSPRSKLTLKAIDAHAGVKKVFYKIDEGDFRGYGSQIPIAGLENGNHKVSYYSEDAVGNTEEVKNFDFYLDKLPPVSQSAITGDQYEDGSKLYVSGRSQIALEAKDNHAGTALIAYQVNRGQVVHYAAPFHLTDDNGNKRISYYAVDKVQNDGNSPAFSAEYRKDLGVILDKDAPVLNSEMTGKSYRDRDTTFITSETGILLGASDGLSGVKSIDYSINESTNAVYTEPLHFEKEGTYSIKYQGTDNVNNQSYEQLLFVVDNTGPVASFILSAESVGSIALDDETSELKVYSAGVKVYLAATDAVISTKDIFYTLDGGKQMKYEHPITLSTKGIHTMTVTAFDQLGNESQEQVTMKVFVK